MNKMDFDGFERVSKIKAKKEFSNGATIRICMCKINPTNKWHLYEDVNLNTIDDIGYDTSYNYGFDFDVLVNGYEFYHKCNECGYYASFYIEK